MNIPEDLPKSDNDLEVVEIYPNLDEAELNERAEHDFKIVDASGDNEISFDEWCAGTIN